MMSGMSFEKKRHHRHATLDFEPKCLEHTPTLFVLRNFITIAIEKRKERNNDPERQAYGSKHHESEFRAKTDEKKNRKLQKPIPPLLYDPNESEEIEFTDSRTSSSGRRFVTIDEQI